MFFRNTENCFTNHSVKNKTFSYLWKIFRENILLSNLVIITSNSRNFCKKYANSTLHSAYVKIGNSLTPNFSREINSFVTYFLVKTLVSRNFCQKSVSFVISTLCTISVWWFGVHILTRFSYFLFFFMRSAKFSWN